MEGNEEYAHDHDIYEGDVHVRMQFFIMAMTWIFTKMI